MGLDDPGSNPGSPIFLKMIFKTTVAIIYNSQGGFLIQDRRKKSKWGEDYCLFGGKIEPGETPEEAIIREIYEELTFDLGKLDFEFFKKQSEKDLKLTGYDFQIERSSYIFEMPNLTSLIVREGEPAIIP